MGKSIGSNTLARDNLDRITTLHCTIKKLTGKICQCNDIPGLDRQKAFQEADREYKLKTTMAYASLFFGDKSKAILARSVFKA